jgi:diguanylate cyclase (GGDEF)-like protein/PAS domain S-box-containing protein
VSLSRLSASSPPGRLLIVDDDPVFRMVAREWLGTNGFEVVEASGGAEGIEVFGELSPHLVLLDVEMPEVNGFDVCKAIRDTAKGRDVPILMLTARDDIESIEQAYETAATDFVTKPIHWLILAHRIRYMLRASENLMAIRSQQVRLDEVQQHARLGSWEVDVRTRSFSTSRTFRSLVGLGEEIERLPLERMFELVHPEDRPALERKIGEAFGNRDGFTLEHRVLTHGGVERILHSQARVRTGTHGECLALEGFSQDVTDRRRAEEQIRLLAFSDSLTGIANRAALKLQLERAIKRSERTGRTIGILFIDLDNFKRVNDTLGHTAGDHLLRIVADLLVGLVRESDVVARDAHDEPPTVSRLGGDEFTILLEDLKSSSDASRVAERVLEAIARPILVESHDIWTTASIGIAIWPQDGPDLESLLRNADAAMYHAKELGRANYQYYRRSLNADALERLELESDLSRAIQDEGLLLNFQPQLELTRGRISACEALARWPHSRRGLVPPSTFIPIAERSGMISALGEWVLRRACASARAWQEGGHPDVRVAVNVSPSQIKDERLVATIEQVLHETGFDPRLLEFEITESAFLHDASRTLLVFEQLQGLGCQISLDDFGTHYSALTNLKRFAVQSLKIDRCFVSGIGSSREDEAIITATLAMARSLGIRVVAEGIETEEQLAFLREHQCDEVQGFLISKPLNAVDFRTFLDQTTSERACREKCSLGS